MRLSHLPTRIELRKAGLWIVFLLMQTGVAGLARAEELTKLDRGINSYAWLA